MIWQNRLMAKADSFLNELFRIVSGALRLDIDKVRNYTEFLAEKLEKAIRESDSAVPTMLQGFTSALRIQIDAIEQALPLETLVLEIEPKKSFDPIAASQEVTRLRSQLKASDGASEETFRTLQNVLAGQVEKARLNALGADISDFDFAGALSKLDDLAKEHNLNHEEVKG